MDIVSFLIIMFFFNTYVFMCIQIWIPIISVYYCIVWFFPHQALPLSSVMTTTRPARFTTFLMATTRHHHRRWDQMPLSSEWQRFQSSRTPSTSATLAACWNQTLVSYRGMLGRQRPHSILWNRFQPRLPLVSCHSNLPFYHHGDDMADAV